MRKRFIQGFGALAITAAAALGTSPAGAGHDHFVVTPNGRCHQVAAGQTGISDPGHGGYHRFHEHVHFGATAGSGAPHELGDGHSRVVVYKDDCLAP